MICTNFLTHKIAYLQEELENAIKRLEEFVSEGNENGNGKSCKLILTFRKFHESGAGKCYHRIEGGKRRTSGQA